MDESILMMCDIWLLIQDSDLLLGEWDRDVMILERVPQGKIYITLDICQTASRILDPKPQNIIDRAIAEIDDVAHGLTIL